MLVTAALPAVAAMAQNTLPANSAPATTPAGPDLSVLLLDLLGEGDAATKRAAAASLLQAGGVEPLAGVLQRKNDLAAKQAVCEAITASGSQELAFVAPLLSLLESREDVLRQAAFRALSGYRDAETVATLKLYRERLERQWLLERVEVFTRQLYERQATDAEKSSFLIARLQDHQLAVQRYTALDIVHEIIRNGKAPTDPVLQQIRSMLSDEDEVVRREALEVLRDLRRADDAPLIRTMLNRPQSPILREAAYKALGLLGDPASIPVCIQALEDPEQRVAAEAAMALGLLALPKLNAAQNGLTEQAVAALSAKAGMPMDDDGLRGAIVEAMATIADKSFLPVLSARASGDEPVPAIRQAAVRGLGRIGDESQIAVVLDRLANDPDPRVREVAAEALGRLGKTLAHTDALKPRLDVQQEPSVAVQKRAWESFRLIYLRLPAEERERILSGWAGSDAASITRRIDLLTDLEKQLSGSATPDPAALVKLRERLGDELIAAGRGADAAGVLSRAVDLTSADADRQRVTLKLVEAHLRGASSDKALEVVGKLSSEAARNAAAELILRFAEEKATTDRQAAGTLLAMVNGNGAKLFSPALQERLSKAHVAMTTPLPTQPSSTTGAAP